MTISIYESFKSGMLYLQAHPYERYSILAAILALMFLLMLWPKKSTKANHSTQISPHELNAIAGEDVITTQLDLAKAYIEMDNLNLAKKILKKVIKQGSQQQKKAAQHLLASL